MAINAPGSLGVGVDMGRVVVPVSVRGSWVPCISDLEATAETSAVLLRPLSATSAYITPVKVGPGTRAFFRVRYTAGATITTSPVIRFYAVYGKFDVGAFADDGTVNVIRIDNADNNAAGVTLTCSSGADIRDTTYAYSDVAPDLSGYDCLGADYLLALIETAANISTGTPRLEVMLLN